MLWLPRDKAVRSKGGLDVSGTNSYAHTKLVKILISISVDNFSFLWFLIYSLIPAKDSGSFENDSDSFNFEEKRLRLFFIGFTAFIQNSFEKLS